MSTLKSIARLSSLAIGILLALLLTLTLLLPRLTNVATVKARIQEEFFDRLGGNLEFQRIGLSFSPRPRVIIHKVSFSFPEVIQGNLEYLRIYPAISSFLRGRVRIARVEAESPHLRLQLTAGQQGLTGTRHPVSQATVQEEMSSLLGAVASSAPGLVVVVDNGSLDVSKDKKDLLSFTAVEADIVFPAGGVNLLINGKVAPGKHIPLSKGTPDSREVMIEGHITVTPPRDTTTPRIALELIVHGLNVGQARETALALAPDIPFVHQLACIIRGGKIPLFTFRTQGDAVADLGSLENILIRGVMHEGEILVPGPELDLEDVTGEVVISNGILEGEKLGARLGNSRGHDGKLKLGLLGKGAPFRLDMMVQADVSQLPPLLSRLVKSGAFVKEMSLMDELRGSAQGRLVLGERNDSIQPRIEIRNLSLSTRYRRVPFLSRIERGEFCYEGNRISVKNLAGALGMSSFEGLAASIEFQDSPYLEIASARCSAALAEVYSLIASSKRLRNTLAEIKTLRGTLELSELRLKGPLFNPEKWTFLAAGNVKGISTSVSQLSRPANITSGGFTAVKEKISFSDVNAHILDASFGVSGVLKGYLEGLPGLDLSVKGTVGPEANQWFSALIKLPPELRVQTPLLISDGHLGWGKGTGIAFRGGLSVQHGPNIFVDCVKNPEELTIRDLTIHDGDSRAAITLNLKNKVVDLTFVGALTETTLDKILAKSLTSQAWLQGDFRFHFVIDQPLRSSAQGHLEGRDLLLPWKGMPPLRIDRVSMDGQENRLRVDSAAVRWEDRHCSLKGDMDATPEGIVLDMDLSTDGFRWEDIQEALRKGEKGAHPEKARHPWDVPITGIIRCTSDYFSYGSFTWSPVHADVSLAKDRVRVAVSDATYLCGVSFPGVIEVTPEELSLNFRPVTSNHDLIPAASCIQKQHIRMTGRFDLQAEVAGQGKADASFGRSLKGSANLTARDGRIDRFDLLSKILSVLNVTEILRGKIPDLTKQGFDYRSLSIQADLQNDVLLLKQAVLDSSNIDLVAQGNVNLIDDTVRLEVLAAPLKTVDSVVRKIPLVGTILGGTLVTVPLIVEGNLENPKVTVLSASLVGATFSRLVDVMESTVKTPVTVGKTLAGQQAEK